MVAAVAVSRDLAAWCGIAAPLLLGVYLEIGGRLRPGYDKRRHTISELGDGVDIAAWLFLLANAAVGILLFVFGRWAVRPVFGDVWWMVAVAAAGSVVIGLTPGNENCRFPGFYGRPSAWFHAAHNVVTFANIVLIGSIPIFVWVNDLGWHASSAQFRWVNNAVAVGFPFAVVAFAVATAIGRRQLRSRLIVASRRTRPAARPWEEPRLWLDRWGTGERIVFAIGYTWLVAAALAELWQWVTAGGATAFFVVAVVTTLKPQKAAPQARFSTDTCQDNTVYGFNAEVGEFRMLRITDVGEFRASLREYLARRHGRGPQTPDSEYAITLGFTHAGVLELGERYRWAAGGNRDDPFGAGMVKRRELLGDDPDAWEPGWERVHLVVWLVARGDHGCARARAEMNSLRGVAVPDGLGIVRGRSANDVDRPLFHVRDGISQPWIREVPPRHDRNRPGNLARDPRGGGKIAKWRRWQPLAVGEFVLGQVDESNDVFPVPDPAPLFMSATFAAVRKLELRRERLGRVLDQLASSRDDRDEALSKLIGRTADGTPLIRERRDKNRFRFDTDPYGKQCPITAHIRRANPRDSLGFAGLLANRRRMIRRGLFYVGDPNENNAPLTGLMFVALQARLDDQFEFVQRRWLNDGGTFGIGRDPDVIAGHWTGERQVLLPADDGPSIASLPGPIVVARGGAYVVVPSIRGLHYLARPVTADRQPCRAPAPPARQSDRDPTAVRA